MIFQVIHLCMWTARVCICKHFYVSVTEEFSSLLCTVCAVNVLIGKLFVVLLQVCIV